MNNNRNINILDLILTNCGLIFEVCICTALGSSDHSSINFKVTWNSTDASNLMSRYSFIRTSYDAIIEQPSDFNGCDISRDPSTEDLWKVSTTILSDCMRKYVLLM